MFIDHNEKTTTFVDPRTYFLRKHDIRDIVEGELPFGWDECFDQECGIYYIDHTSATHYLEAPWTEEVQNQVLASGGGTTNVDENRQFEQERAVQAEREIAEEKVNLLVKEKERLEAEIQEVAESMNEPENHEQIGELCQHEEALKEELELINSQIAREMIEAGDNADEEY
jgi:hypothetical protein